MRFVFDEVNDMWVEFLPMDRSIPTTNNNEPILFTNPMPWADKAACRDTAEVVEFFPEQENTKLGQEIHLKEINKAKAFCSKCPVVTKCLEYALNDPTVYGVWGGTTTKERINIRKMMNK